MSKKKRTNRYDAFGNVVRVRGAIYNVIPITKRARSMRPGCKAYCFMCGIRKKGTRAYIG